VPRVLHPEFGYLGVPTFGRRLIMFALCGLVAGVAGVNVFKAGREPDPTSAMALAPAEALGNTVLVSPAEKGEFAQNIPNTGALRSDCQKEATEYVARNCAAVKPRRPRSILAINERPEKLAVLPSEPVLPAAATSEGPQPNSPDTAEAVSAVEITPAPAVTTQTRSSQAQQHGKNQNTAVQHRYRHEYHFSSNYKHGYSSNYSHDYVQSGYARLW
jgi:hypothetical protein